MSDSSEDKGFNLKMLIENNPVIFICTVAITAFTMGWGVHEAISHATNNNPLIAFRSCEFNAKGKIDFPSDNSKVSRTFLTTGKIYGEIAEGHHIWLVVNPENSFGWYPQVGEIVPDVGSGKWQQSTIIGTDNESKNRKFKIALVEVDKDGNSQFKNNIASRNYPEEFLPDNTKFLYTITVTRQ
jgi:hypothetical protein